MVKNKKSTSLLLKPFYILIFFVSLLFIVLDRLIKVWAFVLSVIFFTAILLSRKINNYINARLNLA